MKNFIITMVIIGIVLFLGCALLWPVVSCIFPHDTNIEKFRNFTFTYITFMVMAAISYPFAIAEKSKRDL